MAAMDHAKPTPPALRRLLDEALQARARGDHAQAGQLAVRAMQMDANCAEAHYLAGLASLDARQLGPALEHLNRALAIETENAEYATHFARALAMSGRYGHALQVANIAPQVSGQIVAVLVLQPEGEAARVVLGGPRHAVLGEVFRARHLDPVRLAPWMAEMIALAARRASLRA